MFEDIHIPRTCSVIELSIREPNSELHVDVLADLGEVHCTILQ